MEREYKCDKASFPTTLRTNNHIISSTNYALTITNYDSDIVLKNKEKKQRFAMEAPVMLYSYT